MSDSNRSRLGQAGLAVAALTSLVMGFGLYAWTSLEQSQHQIAAERDAQYEADTASERVQLECSIAEIPKAECDKRINHESYEAQEGTRDLEAQQTMAVWTRAMGIAAIIGMAVGILGLGLIFFTFRETRRAADAGFTANEIAKKTADAQLRPYLGIEDVLPKPPLEKIKDIQVNFKNFGQTPAQNVRQDIGFTYVPVGTDSWPVFSGAVELSREIFPGHSQKAILNLDDWQSELKSVLQGAGAFRIVIRVTYEGLGEPREPLLAKIIYSHKGANVALESLSGALIDDTAR